MTVALQSRLWVAAQFALVALMLAWPAPWAWSAAGVALGALAVAAVLWVFVYNRPGNFNIRPEPKQGARLIMGGPYRWVRHPMYVALLLGMGAVAILARSGWQAAMWVVLAVVLNFKAALEERLLAQRWPEYAAYCARTRRFIPGVW